MADKNELILITEARQGSQSLVVSCQGIYIRKEKLTQALNCSCISELNTGAFTINLIVNAP